MAKTPYEILGVAEKATVAEVKKAYRTLVKVHHPDKNGTVDGFTQIQKAYELLSDPKRRKAYDVLHGVVDTSKQQQQSPNMSNNWYSGGQGNNFVNKMFQQAMYQQAQAQSSIGMTGTNTGSGNKRQRRQFHIPRVSMIQARVNQYPMFSYVAPTTATKVEITIDCSSLTDYPMPGDIARLEFDMGGMTTTMDTEVIEARYYPSGSHGGIMGEIKFRTNSSWVTHP